jgi:hypothetical protein
MSNLRLVLAVALLAACGDVASSPSDADDFAAQPAPGADGDGKADGTGTPPGKTFTLAIADGAVAAADGRPNVVAYVPAHLDTTQPLNVVIYLHGFDNCAANVIKPKNAACTPGGPARNAYNLANQLESSKKNAILVVPELAFDAASSDPGLLTTDDQFELLLTETLEQLGDAVGGQTLWDVNQIIVSSHSGGYHAAAAILSHGGVWTSEVYLLDSLYGDTDQFDAWVSDPGSTEVFGDQTYRFVSIYSRYSGQPLPYTQAMADRAKAWFGDGVILDDRTTATMTPAAFAHGVIFKLTGLAHDDVPRYYFGKLLATSKLPDIGS